ncbi:MAG: OprD family outer membrane porin [Desulfovibrionaceae bacterium]
MPVLLKLGRLTGLALCLMLLASNAVFAEQKDADSVWGALRNGTLKGYARLYYMKLHTQLGSTQESMAIGGMLHYETAWYKHVSAGIAGYTSQPFFIDQKSRAGAGLLDSKQEGYSALGQAYIKIKAFNSTGQFYRQELDTPFLINPNDSRMTPVTFEAYTIRSTPVKHLNILASHVTKMKDRTSTTFVEMSSAAGYAARQPVSLIGATYDFLDNYSATAWEYYSWEMMNSVYAELTGSWDLSDGVKAWAGVQFLQQQDTGQAIAGTFNTGAAGAKVGAQYKNFDVELAATFTDDNHDIVDPYDGSYPGYNSVMEEDFNRAGENSGRVSVHYNLGGVDLTGLHAYFTFVQSVTPNAGSAASPNMREFDYELRYQFADIFPEDAYLKGLTFRARYAEVQQDKVYGGVTYNDVRLLFDYNFIVF